MNLLVSPLLYDTLSVVMLLFHTILGIVGTIAVLCLNGTVRKPWAWVWVPLACRLLQMAISSHIAVVCENAPPLSQLLLSFRLEQVLSVAVWVVFPWALLRVTRQIQQEPIS